MKTTIEELEKIEKETPHSINNAMRAGGETLNNYERLRMCIPRLIDDIKQLESIYDRMNLKNYEIFDEQDKMLEEALDVLSWDQWPNEADNDRMRKFGVKLQNYLKKDSAPPPVNQEELENSIIMTLRDFSEKRLHEEWSTGGQRQIAKGIIKRVRDHQ